MCVTVVNTRVLCFDRDARMSECEIMARTRARVRCERESEKERLRVSCAGQTIDQRGGEKIKIKNVRSACEVQAGERDSEGAVGVRE